MTLRNPLRNRESPPPGDRPQPVRFVRMVKSGSTSIANWLIDHGYGRSMGHAPAWAVAEAFPGVPLWGTVRHPIAWYRSWYAHCMRGYPKNRRLLESMRQYGGGSEAFRDVLYGLTHPEVRRPHLGDNEYRDHLINPAGWFLEADEPAGLWSRSMMWFFGAREVKWWGDDWAYPPGPYVDGGRVGDAWAVDWLIDLDHEGVQAHLWAKYPEATGEPLIHRNSMQPLRQDIADQIALEAWDPEMVRWVLDADSAMIAEVRRAFGARLMVPEGVRL